MLYFENDKSVLEWFERALCHPTAHIRRQAVLILEFVDCVHRQQWLDRALCDPDPTVAATSVIVSALTRDRSEKLVDLYESDFATGANSEDLRWEWEYELIVCDKFFIPAVRMLAWTQEEDDGLAREIALLKCYAGKEHEKENGTGVIVSKRLVTRYTRAARSFTEAVLWHQGGRPRYPGP